MEQQGEVFAEVMLGPKCFEPTRPNCRLYSHSKHSNPARLS